MKKNKSSSYRWALGFVFTPALVGAAMGIYIALVGIYVQIKSTDVVFSLLTCMALLFYFPVLTGVVGLIFYSPPAFILAVIAVALHEKKTIKSLMILTVSAACLTGSWLFLLDDVLIGRHSERVSHNGGHWSSFLWIIQEWGYAGPALIGACATLILALVGRYFMREK